jgi:hypothetical protein
MSWNANTGDTGILSLDTLQPIQVPTHYLQQAEQHIKVALFALPTNTFTGRSYPQYEINAAKKNAVIQVSTAFGITDLFKAFYPNIVEAMAYGFKRKDTDPLVQDVSKEMYHGMIDRYGSVEGVNYFLQTFPGYAQVAYTKTEASFQPGVTPTEIAKLINYSPLHNLPPGWASHHYWPYDLQRPDKDSYSEEISHISIEQEREAKRQRELAPQRAAATLQWSLLGWNPGEENTRDMEQRRLLVNFSLTQFMANFFQNMPISTDLKNAAEYVSILKEKIWFADQMIEICKRLNVKFFKDMNPSQDIGEVLHEITGYTNAYEVSGKFFDKLLEDITVPDQGRPLGRDALPPEIFRKIILKRFGYEALQHLGIQYSGR